MDRGFTLIEVMIALAILAISLSALIESLAQFSYNQGLLVQKYDAHLVAWNQIVGGEYSKNVQQQDFAGRIFIVETQLSILASPLSSKVGTDRDNLPAEIGETATFNLVDVTVSSSLSGKFKARLYALVQR